MTLIRSLLSRAAATSNIWQVAVQGAVERSFHHEPVRQYERKGHRRRKKIRHATLGSLHIMVVIHHQSIKNHH